MSAEHWDLVAPFWRWELADGVELVGPDRVPVTDNREVAPTTPALHKYAGTDFVESFLGDPRTSLPFLDVDHHHESQPIPPGELYVDPDAPAKQQRFLGTHRRVRTDTRKLFLPAHSRFYVVAVALHCRVPGYPMVDPTAVEEVGFVVRRRPSTELSGAGAAAALRIAAERSRARSKANLALAASRAQALTPLRSVARRRVLDAAQASVDSLVKVHQARQELQFWAIAEGLELTSEGWVPDDERTGSWVALPGQPTELVERRYPMRLLTPPADDPDHPAHDQTIYWGVVPVASDEVAPDGAARFTEEHPFEVQVYARPRSDDACPAPLRWSAPSRQFRLASFGDPDGCAQRPVELRMPSLPELAASTAPPSVRVSTPPGSQLEVPATGEMPSGEHSPGDGQICFISIPLITIIAMFVLNLFLPIVLFVFQLWWMLKLKFCIPPSLSFDAGIAADLDFEPGGLDLDVEVAVTIETAFAGLDPTDQQTVRDALDAAYAGTTQMPLGQEMGEDLTIGAWLELAARRGHRAEDPWVSRFPDPLGATPSRPGAAPLVSVTRDQVVHP